MDNELTLKIFSCIKSHKQKGKMIQNVKIRIWKDFKVFWILYRKIKKKK